jgi:hypothetical protein
MASPGRGLGAAALCYRPAMTFVPHLGRCTCGEVRFSMARDPLFVHCCHCTWCQRETGSAFALNAMIETDAVTLHEGTPETIDTPSNSGLGQRIQRCPTCRVAVWSHYGKSDRLAFVRVGALEDPSRCPPSIHIFTTTKLPWVILDGEAPVMAEYYSKREHWPEESLARLAALLGGKG